MKNILKPLQGSLRWKATIFPMIVALSAMILVTFVFLVFDFIESRNQLQETILTQSEILAENLVATISFDRPEEAHQILASSRFEKSVSHAVIYKSSGELFSAYVRDLSVQPEPSMMPVYENMGRFDNDRLYLWTPIGFAGEPLGALYMEYSLVEFYSNIYRRIFIVIIIMLLTLPMAFVLTLRLKQTITTPVESLVNTALHISMEYDYSIRAEKYAEDELGQLAAAFNTMLDLIQVRDRELARYADIVKHMQVGLHVYHLEDLNDDHSLRLVDANPAAARFTGFSCDDVIGKTIDENFAYLRSKDIPHSYAQVVLTGEICTLEDIVYGRDRIVKYAFAGKAFPLPENRVGVTFENITEQKREEAKRKVVELQLQQVQRLDSLGVMAGGINHDFNNILNNILGLSALLRKTDNEDARIKNLELIEVCVARGTKMIDRLNRFALQPTHGKQMCDVGVMLREAVQMIKPTFPGSIDWSVEIADEVFMAYTDPVQFNQVVMNLCINAQHAMPDGGTLKIGLVNIPPHTKVDGQYGLPSNDSQARIRLSVQDSGVGIAEDICQKIFDPFFTTKTFDKGTGLGLSMVHGIARDLGGSVSFDTEPGKGSTFYFCIPSVSADKTTEGEPLQKADVATENHLQDKRVLFLDDEELAVMVAEKMLTDAGCHVTSFHDSREALDAFEKDPAAYDMVVTDLTMPYISGVELARKIRSIRSDLPIIICTGYGKNIDLLDGWHEVVDEVLTKPVSIQMLTAAINNLHRH